MRSEISLRSRVRRSSPRLGGAAQDVFGQFLAAASLASFALLLSSSIALADPRGSLFASVGDAGLAVRFEDLVREFAHGLFARSGSAPGVGPSRLDAIVITASRSFAAS